jgi:hypothetical protein
VTSKHQALFDDDDRCRCRGLGSDVLEKQKSSAGLFFIHTPVFALAHLIDRCISRRGSSGQVQYQNQSRENAPRSLIILPLFCRVLGKIRSLPPLVTPSEVCVRYNLLSLSVSTRPELLIRKILIFFCHRSNDFGIN